MAIAITSLLFVVLAALAVGALVRLSIRFGEWFWRRQAARRQRRQLLSERR